MTSERAPSSPAAVPDVRHRLVNQLGSTAGAEVVAFVSSLAFSIIVTRALDRGGKGLFSSALSAIAIGTAIANFGLGKSIIYYVNQASHARGSVSGSILTILPVSLTFAITFSFILLPTAARQGSTLLVVALLAATTIATGFQESFLRSLRRLRPVNVSSLCQSLLQLPILWVLLHVGALDVKLALSVALVTITVRLTLLTLSLAQESELRPQSGQIKDTLQALLRYGVTYQVYSLLWVCHIRLDVLMLERIQGSDSAGIYATGANLAQLLWRVPNALMLVILPHLASMGNERNAMTFAAKSTRTAAPLLVGLALLGYAFADPLIPLLYGENFRGATTSFYILLPGVVAGALHLMLSGSLVASGHLRLLVKNAAIALVANLTLNYFLLIPRYGDAGAALASAITYGLTFILTVREACRLSGKSPIALLWIQREDWQSLRTAITRRRAAAKRP